MERKNIILWSGGKDSTATICLAKEYGIRIDRIVMSEVMYCNRRGISGEHPLHMEWVYNVAIPRFREWGYQVDVIRGEMDYLSFFNHKILNPKKYPENYGKCFGFPCGKMCGIRRDCKIRPMERYLSQQLGQDSYASFCGICADEPLRLHSLDKRGQRSLLAELGVVQAGSFDICSQYDLLSPTYFLGVKRGGCWMCPFAKAEEHQLIYEQYPKIWDEFVSLEDRCDIANRKWNVFGETLHERDVRLKKY